MSEHEDEYTPEILAVLQLLWGEGMLSPGGEAHLNEIVKGLDLQEKLVLDIGCALGGFDVLLARKYGARLIGVEVEARLIELGQEHVIWNGLPDRVDLRLVEPGPLPFPDAYFDVVFGKDSWIHIEDKHAFFAEVYRVLKPGGVLAAGDWLRSGRILRETGFVDVQLTDIHHEYQQMAHAEYHKLQNSEDFLVPLIGQKWYDHFVEDWRALTVVIDNGDLRPGRLRARKAAEERRSKGAEEKRG